MKLYTRLLLLAVTIIIAVPARAGKKHLATHARAKDIDTLYFIEPVTLIAKITDANTAVYNDTISRIACGIQTNVLHHYGDKMRLADEIDISDKNLKTRVRKEIAMLLQRANNKEYFEDTTYHSVIDSIMDATGRRFVLIELNDGFVRSKDNYKQQRRQNNWNIGIRAMTGLAGMQLIDRAPSADLISSGISVMIIDAKENRTYYYNDDRSTYRKDEYNPVNEGSQLTEFKLLFDGFFWSKPSQERW